MAISIGSENFVSMTGPFNPIGQRVEVFSRPGTDGHEARRMGLKGPPFQVTTFVDVISAAAIKTKIGEYKDLQGTIVSVVDGHGNTWNNVLILQVDAVAVPRLVIAVGGINSPSLAGVGATWSLQFVDLE